MGKQVLNLASYNFTGLSGSETIKVVVLLDSTVLLGFSTIPCVISAFAKRGDIIVAARGVNFVVQKGLQVSRSNVFLSVEKERRKRRGRVTRRFIVTEGISEKDGAMVDLPKLYTGTVPLHSDFGTVGRTGRGYTEFYNVLACICFVSLLSYVGSTELQGHANRHDHRTGCQRAQLIGGFLRSSRIVVDHQHINSTSFVFSAAVPALFAISASEDIKILRNTPSILSTLQENPPNPATPAARDVPWFDIASEERILQDIVDETLAQGVLYGRDCAGRSSLRHVRVSGSLSREERAGGVIKAAVVRVLTKRK
ncbi:hypothetical protein H4582DRAFT_2148192 [Lactarius indigo]|nr:hypothetical protein H4582DRAFT_2148192 [Lactarius indigo]